MDKQGNDKWDQTFEYSLGHHLLMLPTVAGCDEEDGVWLWPEAGPTNYLLSETSSLYKISEDGVETGSMGDIITSAEYHSAINNISAAYKMRKENKAEKDFTIAPRYVNIASCEEKNDTESLCYTMGFELEDLNAFARTMFVSILLFSFSYYAVEFESSNSDAYGQNRTRN